MFQGQTGVDCFNGTSAFDMRNNYGAFPEFLRTSVYHLSVWQCQNVSNQVKKNWIEILMWISTRENIELSDYRGL